MARAGVWMLAVGVLLALAPGRAAGALRASRRPARPRGCAERPEELLEQLYGRLAAGVLGAFHHTLQLGPREQARNASCPAGGRPGDRRFRPPTNLRSVSPWAYRPLQASTCWSVGLPSPGYWAKNRVPLWLSSLPPWTVGPEPHLLPSSSLHSPDALRTHMLNHSLWWLHSLAFPLSSCHSHSPKGWTFISSFFLQAHVIPLIC
ncbi:interleukin-17D isoform X2 [Prionailurus viverrinus]|uniref:interleukin-17D isoform X2 n=1 Tax=Prionailurus viverrinus TaxID=61388 RepID=UPI001FF22E2C|nr:interleukin-17D isoform X2 [Prionailurus viverrinus]